MRAGNIFQAIAESVAHAMHGGLKRPTLSVVAPSDWPAGEKPANRTKKERDLREDDLQVYVFPQIWGSTALGFGGIGGSAMTTAYTVVVLGPCRDAAVYFDGRFAYHIDKLDTRFQDCLAKHAMPAVDDQDWDIAARVEDRRWAG